MVFDLLQIKEILPHRYPFLLVDRILEMSETHIVGLKNVTANEPHFQGHFPEKAVMPGVLIIECMAQVAGVLIGKRTVDAHKKLMLLASIDHARFRQPVGPGDQLRIEATITNFRSTAAKVSGKALVDGKVVAEAELMCAVVDRPGVHADSPQRVG
jgi:3-hydroxyacyl-[acyl-carrier-protein] dehydratase